MSLARGQITIVDLNDAKSMNMYLGSNQPLTQIFNQENKSYVPNFTATPFLVITPELYVSGTTTNVISRLKSAPTYTINGGAITGFGGTVGTTSPWALTIKNNLANVSQMKVECSAVYVDPDTLLENAIKSQIQFSKSENPGQVIRAIGTTPLGNIFKNGQAETLIAHCDLWRGSVIDPTLVSYAWSKLKRDSTYELLTASNAYGITGVTTNEITIPASAVLSFESFKCTITDNDSASGTHNTSVSDILSFTDISDPYTVEMVSLTGEKIINGQGSTTIVARVWQKGELFETTAADAKFVFTWLKYKKDGTQDTTWGIAGVKTGATIVVNASEIQQKATFVADIDYKK